MIDLRLVLAVATVALSSVVAAQPALTPAAPQDTVFFVASQSVTPFGGQVQLIGSEGSVIGGVVTGKPYTADSVTESTQVLSDGNRIVNRNEARIYRDSQGRTRREQTLNALGVWQAGSEPLTMTTINDPVADVSYVLDPARRTARQIQAFRLAVDGNATWKAGVPAPPPGAVTARRQVLVDNGVVTTDAVVGGTVEAGTATAPVPFEVALPPPGAGPGVAMRGAIAGGGPLGAGGPVFNPQMRTAARTFASGVPFPGLQATTEELGDQVLEGVLAHGTRQTQTIPAGTMGNERAIDIVAEQWYSEEIEAVVLRRNSDPRFGETTYRLVNLVRGEPAPDLFAVPQGYELLAEPAFPPPPHIEMRALPSEPAAGGEPAGGRAERRVFIVQPDPAGTQK